MQQELMTKMNPFLLVKNDILKWCSDIVQGKKRHHEQALNADRTLAVPEGAPAATDGGRDQCNTGELILISDDDEDHNGPVQISDDVEDHNGPEINEPPTKKPKRGDADTVDSADPVLELARKEPSELEQLLATQLQEQKSLKDEVVVALADCNAYTDKVCGAERAYKKALAKMKANLGRDLAGDLGDDFMVVDQFERQALENVEQLKKQLLNCPHQQQREGKLKTLRSQHLEVTKSIEYTSQALALRRAANAANDAADGHASDQDEGETTSHPLQVALCEAGPSNAAHGEVRQAAGGPGGNGPSRFWGLFKS